MTETKTLEGPEALAGMLAYQDHSIVSRTLHKNEAGTLTVFAFDEGEALSEHTAPFDAFVQVIDGEAVISIAGKETTVAAGSIVRMPAEVPHAVRAERRFQMLLSMFRK